MPPRPVVGMRGIISPGGIAQRFPPSSDRSVVASLRRSWRSARPAPQRPARPTPQRPARPAPQRPARPTLQRPAEPAAQRPAGPAAQRPSKLVSSGCSSCGNAARPPVKAPARPASTTTASDMRKGTKLVWFFASWCGHCTNMHTAWDEAVDKAGKQGLQMVKIECGNASDPKHSKVSDEYKIRGFPTILLLEDGVRVDEYRGQRTSSAFLSYVEKKSN